MWTAYNQSKLANVMFGYELQERLLAANSSIIVAMVHPGLVVSHLSLKTSTY
jgi:NAD(P)-dependent dehydrogenase (short-subunit alcohol dehydrogenase family)